jgi:hypothetical protein
VSLQKYFSHPSLVIYFFPTPTYKTKIETPNKWENTNSKQPGQGALVTSYLLHSSLAVLGFAGPKPVC